MKLKHPGLLKFVGWAGAFLLRRWIGTLRVRVHCEAPEADPRVIRQGLLFSLWHETMLLPAVVFADCGVRILVSQHNDGEYITRILDRLGFGTVRGSTTRGAVRAVRELARTARGTNIGITPDGPQGPRQELKNGIVFLASRTGLSIVPMGFAFERPWRAASWDRFVLPRPFTRAAVSLGAPMHVPGDADAAALAYHHQLLSEAMARATSDAERVLAPLTTEARGARDRPGAAPQTGRSGATPRRTRRNLTLRGQ